MSPLNQNESARTGDDVVAELVADESELLPDPMTNGVEVTELDSEDAAAFAEFESK